MKKKVDSKERDKKQTKSNDKRICNLAHASFLPKTSNSKNTHTYTRNRHKKQKKMEYHRALNENIQAKYTVSH